MPRKFGALGSLGRGLPVGFGGLGRDFLKYMGRGAEGGCFRIPATAGRGGCGGRVRGGGTWYPRRTVRIPGSKFYRAFPELDRFSDAQCEGFVSLVQKRHPWQMVGAAILALAAVLLTVCLLVPLTLVILDRGQRGMDRLPIQLVPLMLGFPFVAAGIAGFLVRDACVRGLIRRRITAMKCTDCGYGLLGLPVTRGEDGIARARCPECGYENDMTSRERELEDAAALRARDDASPPAA